VTSIPELEALLDECDRADVFRFRFLDEEVYDLKVFAIHRDLEETVPRCSAEVHAVIVQNTQSRRHFRPGKVMEFSLSEVQRVERTSDGSVLYEAA